MSIRRFEIGPLSTNCYILTDEKTNESVIIDPAFCTEKLMQEAEKTNIKYILLTHAHADHIMAVHSIKEKCGAKIVAHENEAERLLSARANLHSAIPVFDLPEAATLHPEACVPLSASCLSANCLTWDQNCSQVLR